MRSIKPEHEIEFDSMAMRYNPGMIESITITRPDDWHLHVRDKEMLKVVVPMTANQFGRAMIMPNLNPPVTHVEQALAYRKDILSALPGGTNFDPKMSLYLTDSTTKDEVKSAASNDHILGFKLYPAGATTNSASGVTRISNVMSVLETMADCGLVLQVHGEVTDPHVDIFDREALFIDQILIPLHRELPELKIVFEHVTTTQGVEFVSSTSHRVAATITPQHLIYNRNEIFRGGIRPHNYCLPVLKRESHRQSLLQAVSGGDPSFFLGTDSAPHSREQKESACGCAGIFSAKTALEIYTEIFEEIECLHLLEGFASHHGADFYGIERNTDTVTLARKNQTVPDSIPVAGSTLVPLRAGEIIGWSIAA